MADKKPIVTLPTVPGEAPADRIVRIVNSFIGCSLSNRRDELGRLVARGVDDPNKVVGIATNCATSALGVMALAGVKDEQLNQKYITGMAIAWVRRIGKNTGALTAYTGPNGPQPRPGCLMRYNTPGTNNDHVEWLMSEVDANGEADHAGGGRPNNEISMKHGNIFKSAGRPLLEFWDPDKLGIDFVPAEDVEEPTPDAEPTPVPIAVSTTSAGKFWENVKSLLNKVKFPK